METNLNNNKLNLNEMQDLLADYSFGKLSEFETQIFELNLPDYPELQKEIKEVKSVFERFESIDFDKIVSDNTRNLSIKVNNRLERRKRFSFYAFNKFAIPSVLALALIYIAFNAGSFTGNNENNDKKIETAQNSGSKKPPILPEKYNKFIKQKEIIATPEMKTQQLLLNQSTNDVSELNDGKSIADDPTVDDLDDLEFYSILEELDDVDFDS